MIVQYKVKTIYKGKKRNFTFLSLFSIANAGEKSWHSVLSTVLENTVVFNALLSLHFQLYFLIFSLKG